MTDWLAEVPTRPFVERALVTRFALQPGDRPLLDVGAGVQAGEGLFERLRERRVTEVVIPAGSAAAQAAARGAPASAGGRRRSERALEGELLAPIPGSKDKWRLATGDQREVVSSPVDGTVTAVVPGAGMRGRAAGLALTGSLAA